MSITLCTLHYVHYIMYITLCTLHYVHYIMYTSAPLIIPKFLVLKQAACFVMVSFYKHVTIKHAK